MSNRVHVRHFNFPSTPLVVVTSSDGDEDVDNALVRLSPVLDASQRGVYDREGAKTVLLDRGAIGVMWAPQMLSPQHGPEAAEPRLEGDHETVAHVVSAWINQSGANTRTCVDACAAVASILKHAEVSG